MIVCMLRPAGCVVPAGAAFRASRPYAPLDICGRKYPLVPTDKVVLCHASISAWRMKWCSRYQWSTHFFCAKRTMQWTCELTFCGGARQTARPVLWGPSDQEQRLCGAVGGGGGGHGALSQCSPLVVGWRAFTLAHPALLAGCIPRWPSRGVVSVAVLVAGTVQARSLTPSARRYVQHVCTVQHVWFGTECTHVQTVSTYVYTSDVLRAGLYPDPRAHAPTRLNPCSRHPGGGGQSKTDQTGAPLASFISPSAF